MWNNLRARHYSILILMAIVLLETSAIAIDKFVSRKCDVAFDIDSSFKNNIYVDQSAYFEDDDEGTYADEEETDEVYTAEDEQIVLAEETENFETEIENVSASIEVAAAPAPETITSEIQENDDKYIKYSIKSGDSLSDIALRFGSETGKLKQVNNISDDHVIKIGETIKIPMPTNDIQYVVRKGDSLSKIASRFKIPQEEIVKVNSLNSPNLKMNQKLTIPVMQQISLNKENETLTRNLSSFDITSSNMHMAAIAPAEKTSISAFDRIAKAEIAALNTNAPIVALSNEVDEKNDEKVDEKIPDGEFTYKISQGDSLLKLANKYNTTVAQIQYDNNISGTLVKVGQTIKINPNKKMYRIVSSNNNPENIQKAVLIKHKVAKGESLSLIAKKYNATVNSIIAQNNLHGTSVMAGQIIKVPAKGYKITAKSTSAYASTQKNWKKPTRGWLSSPYGWRTHPVYKSRKFHSGVDLAAAKGTPIIASTGGKVIYAGHRAGYGNLIIIAHEDGYSTRYAHCSSILAQKGQQVKAGQIIARVGATGVATGNHLHFEVRKNGKTKNPLGYVNVK